MDITDKIKTVEDAYKHLGMDREKSLPQISNVSEKDKDYLICEFDLWIISRALNEDWEADFLDANQLKYFNWFYVDSSGAFRFYDADFTHTHTHVGSRLCFKNRKIAKYAATQFIELYKRYYLS